MNRTAVRALRVGAPLAAVACLALVDPALAQKAAEKQPQAGENLGQNLANLIAAWLTPLVAVIGGGAMLAGFSRRNMGVLVSASVVTLVSGIFIIAPTRVNKIIEGLADSLVGT